MNHDTLKRLLGPAERELLCDECFEQLDRYVELESQGEEADARIPGMRAHLQGCPACHEDYESLRELVQSEPTSESTPHKRRPRGQAGGSASGPSSRSRRPSRR